MVAQDQSSYRASMDTPNDADAELILAVRNSLPALLEVVEAARELFVALVEISPIEINCPPKADKELNEKANVMRRALAALDKPEAPDA